MGTLLVVGSGQREFREYILRAAASRHALVLIQDKPVSWQRPYVIDALCADMSCASQAVAAAKQLASRHALTGLLCYDEASVEVASIIAAALGLRYHSVDSIRRCRDKLATRQALARAGVPSATSVLVSSLQDAQQAAARIGLPVVLKPRSLAGSFGVIRVDSADQLPLAFAAAAGASIPNFHSVQGVLLEEYLDGPEVSVECVVLDGEVHVLAVTRKQVDFAPYFEEVGHIVSAAPSDQLPDERAVVSVAVAAQQALGLARGVTHTELRLTRGGPKIVEVNARLGGDLIPYLVQLATGIDVAAAAVDVAAGAPPNLVASRQAAAGVRFLYPPCNARVRCLATEPVANSLGWIERIVWTAAAGDELKLPPDGYMGRLGLMVVTGATAADCQARLDQFPALARIELEPLERTAVAA